jgi:hypothetical protein
MHLRALLSALLLLLFTNAAHAQQWQFEDLDIPIAWFDNGSAQFQFACRGGDLAMGYWVRAPHHQVASASVMNLAIIPDPSTAATSTAGASFAQEIPLIHADGTSMIIRGPVARQWARIAQRAKTTIRLAYVRMQSTLELFDSNDFPATGSAAAIKHILDRCG